MGHWCRVIFIIRVLFRVLLAWSGNVGGPRAEPINDHLCHFYLGGSKGIAEANYVTHSCGTILGFNGTSGVGPFSIGEGHYLGSSMECRRFISSKPFSFLRDMFFFEHRGPRTSPLLPFFSCRKARWQVAVTPNVAGLTRFGLVRVGDGCGGWV